MGSVHASCATADGGCPVDHKNMSTDEINHMMQRYNKMGAAAFTGENPSAPKPQPEPPEASKVSNHSTVTEKSSSAEPSSCPVDDKSMTEQQKAAYMANLTPSKSTTGGPLDEPTMYDVYGQELDRANLMPATPNQLPSPRQKQPLSTDRVKSSIPKSGAEDTWTYPSPQMFFNALKRKGKADGVEESDMSTVVSVHNAMNERTWHEVLQWERTYHCSQCDNPTLKSFMGRPHDLSPAARFRTWFRGYPMPFDRHDWIVDRCGEQDARYIIDYYYREGPDPIEIHVRPALDSFSAAYDRMRSGLQSVPEALGTRPRSSATGRVGRQTGHSKPAMPHVVTGDQLEETEFDFLSNLTTADIRDIGDDVNTRCAKISEAFREAGDNPEKLEKANVSVNYCMAQRICKTQAADFMSALESGSDEAEAYEKMASCLERFHIVARRAILEEAGVVQSGPEFPADPAPFVSSSGNPAPASGIE